MMLKKPIYWRSQDYLDFIDSKPCEVSGEPSTHHHENLGMGGTSIKAPDSHCISLAPRLHIPGVHAEPKTFWIKHGLNPIKIIKCNIVEFIVLKGLDIPECAYFEPSIDTIKLLTEFLNEKGL